MEQEKINEMEQEKGNEILIHAWRKHLPRISLTHNVDTKIKVENENVLMEIKKKRKEASYQFKKDEIKSIKCSFKIYYLASDIIFVIASLILLMAIGLLSIPGIAFFVYYMGLQNMKITLQNGKKINVPMMQNGYAIEFLKAIDYDAALIQKCEKNFLSEGKFMVKRTVIFIVLLLLAGLASSIGF